MPEKEQLISVIVSADTEDMPPAFCRAQAVAYVYSGQAKHAKTLAMFSENEQLVSVTDLTEINDMPPPDRCHTTTLCTAHIHMPAAAALRCS